MAEKRKSLRLRIAITKGAKQLTKGVNDGQILTEHTTIKFVSKADFDNTIPNLPLIGYDYCEILEHAELQANPSVGKEYYEGVIERVFGGKKVNAADLTNQALQSQIDELKKLLLAKNDDSDSDDAKAEKELIIKELEELGVEFKKSFSLKRLQEILTESKSK